MHGCVGYELYEWIRSQYGDLALLQLLSTASTKPVGFVTMMAYPDEDFFSFMDGASRILKKTRGRLLEEFGMFVAAALVEAHTELIPASWSALDVIEHADSTIHTVVRRENKDASPPYIRCTRTTAGEVKIIYDSPRKICEFGKGIIIGIGRYYGERLDVRETICMHHGHPQCELIVAAAAMSPGPFSHTP
ncbi:MAG: heme NO-binding domain-containing protein [Candidatus Eremiobacteraeota bacterium]|nr:heme NO-binding domain-containing protein [Candidatus Eremiobacteraeota bacterium]MBC5828006.1 heme NO-binding domain-containing protein [Candidatus Eremiobacteraeota bacterium]